MSVQITPVDEMKASPFTWSDESGLDIKINSGSLDVQNETVIIASTILTLIASQSNYIYVDHADNIIKANTTGFLDKCCPLWIMITNVDSITRKTDKRTKIRMSAHSEYKTQATWLLDVNYNDDSGWVELDLSSVAPSGATMIKVDMSANDSGAPTDANWFGIRKPGETAVPQYSMITPIASGRTSVRYAEMGLDSNKTIEYRVKPDGNMAVKLKLVGWGYGQ